MNQVGAPARVGLIAAVDVVVPPGNTGLDPSQTSFFQVLAKFQVSELYDLIIFQEITVNNLYWHS
mgnify:FL=1